MVLRAVLLALGSPTSHQVSSHSLRRGGTQAAQMSGAAQEDIQVQGTWKSKGSMKTYLAKQSSAKVATSLAHLFGY